MEWDNLIELILNSIQIIGVFIAIIIGLIISKVMDLKKEKNEAIDTIEDITNELENMNKQFNGLKEEQYEFYKEDSVFAIIDLIFEGKECEISNSVPYISEQEQNVLKVADIISKNISIEECKKQLKVEKYSVEETIVDEIYERSDKMEFPNFKLPDFSSPVTSPPIIPNLDYKTPRIVSAIDNIQNINRLRDMDNLSYQIRLKEQQKKIYEKRLKSINSTLDIKIGRILSIIIILISVVIPFLIIAFQDSLECYQIFIYVYLIASFVLSMLSMCIYLFWFWKK